MTTRRSTSAVRVSAPPAAVGGEPAGLGGAERPGFEADTSAVLGELQNALAALLAAAPSPTTSCTEVESALGIDAMLAWQVLRIARATDPFAVGIKVPARVSIGKLIKAASRRRVSDALTQRVSRAFDEYERLVADHAGSRADFEMMVSAYSPEAREKAELAGKQLAFRGMSQVKGVAADVDFSTFFWFPSADPALVDSATLEGHLGTRRIWPGAPIMFSDASTGTQSVRRTLDGAPTDHGQDLLLPQFCTSPLPQFRQHQAKEITYHSVSNQEVGLRSAIDLVRGSLRRSAKSRFRRYEERTHAAAMAVLAVPAKRLTLDVYLHESVYPGASPELAIYDISTDGIMPRFNDLARDHRCLQVHETIRPLGAGFAQAKLTHIPRYVEMLEYACGKLGLKPAEFRGYRLDVQYPLYAVGYMMAFRLPDPPTSTDTH